MGEGWLRHLGGDRYESLSAGAKPSGSVHPLAIQVMAEAGVDISQHRSKSIAEFAGQKLDVLVTVCDNARESCPVFAGAKRTIHQSFDDPAQATGSDAEKLVVFRRVRDEIRGWVENFLKSSK
ncbi:MAG: Arsenate reductase [Verrucomicrobiae bacterium]|nr:Arsenate reductase [Verrucomicrobiae bacterium]